MREADSWHQSKGRLGVCLALLCIARISELKSESNRVHRVDLYCFI